MLMHAAPGIRSKQFTPLSRNPRGTPKNIKPQLIRTWRCNIFKDHPKLSTLALPRTGPSRFPMKTAGVAFPTLRFSHIHLTGATADVSSLVKQHLAMVMKNLICPFLGWCSSLRRTWPPLIENYSSMEDMKLDGLWLIPFFTKLLKKLKAHGHPPFCAPCRAQHHLKLAFDVIMHWRPQGMASAPLGSEEPGIFVRERVVAATVTEHPTVEFQFGM